jgi:ABC-2 type transport system permease protein
VSTDSVIHDIGYQRYTGRRLGRGYATRSLYTHGVRSVFGMGRPAKSKIFPWAMVGVMVVVAVVDIAIRARTGVVILTYRQFCDRLTVPVFLFVAATMPELLCRDLRHNVLPLYFSRPLRRADYVWAKIGAAVTGIWLLYAGPLLLLVVSGLFTVDTWTERIDEVRSFAGGLALAAIYAVVYASIGLVLSAFLRRRMVASAVIVGYFLLTTAVGAVVGQVVGPPRGDTIGRLFGPSRMVAGLESYLWRAPTEGIGPPPQAGPGLFIVRFHPPGPVFLLVAIGLVLVCVVVMHLRYRRVRT